MGVWKECEVSVDVRVDVCMTRLSFVLLIFDTCSAYNYPVLLFSVLLGIPSRSL